MRREFDVIIYSQRNKTETIFSVVKRIFGSELDSHNDVMKTKELLSTHPKTLQYIRIDAK